MMIDKVAAALEQAFKDRVAASASTPEKPMTFEQTGVTAPGFDVWEAYARAAVSSLRAALEEDRAATGSFRTDSYDHVAEFLEDALK